MKKVAAWVVLAAVAVTGGYFAGKALKRPPPIEIVDVKTGKSVGRID